MKELVKEIIVTNQNRLPLLDVSLRTQQVMPVGTRIISLLGARRTGKTFHQFQFIQTLLTKENVEPNQIVYINFEDDRLFPFSADKLDFILQAYFELYPSNKLKKCWFFFDEIQEVLHWEKFIRRIYDTENIALVLTGSSSKLLSKEIATSLRGRTVSYEVFPYSFKEVAMASIPNYSNWYDSAVQHQIKHTFNNYVLEGGFPETITLALEQKRLLWQDYIDLIIYRDLIERHQISNIYLLKYFLKFLIVNQANLFSVNKVFNDFKSQGLAVSKATLFDYLSYVEDAYVLFSVKKWSLNSREQQRNPIKIYVVDIGLKRIMTHVVDSGRALENLVFIELRQKYKEVYYWSDKHELDFCVPFQDRFLLVNVCESIQDFATKEREIQALQEAMTHFKEKKAYLLTLDDETTIETPNGIIKVIPTWKWCLDEENRLF